MLHSLVDSAPYNPVTKKQAKDSPLSEKIVSLSQDQGIFIFHKKQTIIYGIVYTDSGR